ncbi:unnamed protein product [Absidia cylindrospora]
MALPNQNQDFPEDRFCRRDSRFQPWSPTFSHLIDQLLCFISFHLINQIISFSSLQNRAISNWRTSRSNNALLFDITAFPATFTQQWFMKMMAQQTSAVRAVVMKKAHQQRYLEVYPKKDSMHTLQTTGLTFPVGKETYKILPCASLDDDTTIVRLSLTHLPLDEDDDDLKAGITNSLYQYGQIHHVELFKEPASGYFMGTGYAILNLKLNENQTILSPLTHKISYANDGDSFHATWANMPTYCRYCHEEGHTKIECKSSLAGTTCYNCQTQGHRAAQCPSKSMKKARKTQLPSSPEPSASPRTIATVNPFAALAQRSDDQSQVTIPDSTATTASPTPSPAPLPSHSPSPSPSPSHAPTLPPSPSPSPSLSQSPPSPTLTVAHSRYNTRSTAKLTQTSSQQSIADDTRPTTSSITASQEDMDTEDDHSNLTQSPVPTLPHYATNTSPQDPQTLTPAATNIHNSS